MLLLSHLHDFMYFLYSSSHIPVTIMFNCNRVLHLFNFTFYWNLHFLFLVLMTKIYFILHPTVLFSKFLLMQRDTAKCQVNVPNRSIHVVLWLLSKNDIQQSVQGLTKYMYSSQDWLCLLLSLANNCSPSPLLFWFSPNRYQVKSTITE
jgi:hypothetical protein